MHQQDPDDGKRALYSNKELDAYKNN